MSHTGSTITSAAVEHLRSTLPDRVTTPDTAGYDRARSLFYGGLDRRPAAVVRVRDAVDVATVVRAATQHDVELTVRSGGHGVLGHAVVDDAIVVDLSGIRHLDVDVDNRTARVGPGLTTGEYTQAVGEHGLATPFGDAGTVGIGGIALGGGIGLLSRLHGLTVDSVLAADVVTATGEMLHVDDDHHPDLFWALRGGGGNFGIVTGLTLRLHEVSDVLGGDLVLPLTAEVVAGLVAAARSAPREVSMIANIMAPAPPAPFVPPELHGKNILMVQWVHALGGDAGEQAVAPFRALATPVVDTIGPTTYPEMFPDDEPEEGPEAVAANFFLDNVTQADTQRALALLGSSPAMVSVLQLRVLGAAVADRSADATAYPHRDREIMATAVAMLAPDGPADLASAWLDKVRAVLNGSGGYVNFVGDDSLGTARAAYGDNWDRLVAVKQDWDPDNLFRHNVNIPPT